MMDAVMTDAVMVDTVMADTVMADMVEADMVEVVMMGGVIVDAGDSTMPWPEEGKKNWPASRVEYLYLWRTLASDRTAGTLTGLGTQKDT